MPLTLRYTTHYIAKLLTPTRRFLFAFYCNKTRTTARPRPVFYFHFSQLASTKVNDNSICLTDTLDHF